MQNPINKLIRIELCLLILAIIIALIGISKKYLFCIYTSLLLIAFGIFLEAIINKQLKGQTGIIKPLIKAVTLLILTIYLFYATYMGGK